MDDNRLMIWAQTTTVIRSKWRRPPVSPIFFSRFLEGPSLWHPFRRLSPLLDHTLRHFWSPKDELYPPVRPHWRILWCPLRLAMNITMVMATATIIGLRRWQPWTLVCSFFLIIFATYHTCFDNTLNDSQKMVVKFRLESPEIVCIHGPPGMDLKSL